jgi:hypothetical protein
MAFECPRHFTTLTGAPTGRLCWWDCYFVCRSWCSLSLRKNSPRIHTFSRRRISWFAAQAHCRLQIDCPKESRLKAALKIKKSLEPLKHTDSQVRVCFFSCRLFTSAFRTNLRSSRIYDSVAGGASLWRAASASADPGRPRAN